MSNLRKILLAVLAVAFLLFIAGMIFAPEQDVQDVATVAPPAPEVKHAPTVEIKPAKVRAYAPKVKKDLSLPQAVVDNPSIYALGATRIEPDFHPVTVAATIDEQTGETVLYEKREPLPWVALTRRGEIGIAYGIKTNGTMGGRLFINHGLLDVKAVRVGVAATLDQDGTGFAGVSFAYRY